MEFILKPDNRNSSDEELLNDIKRVNIIIGLNSVSQKDYKEHGRFSCATLTRRFGSWANVLKRADLEVENYHFISDNELLNDLKKVADSLNKKSVTMAEYKKHGEYSPDSFSRRFGSWFIALEKVGLEKLKI